MACFNRGSLSVLISSFKADPHEVALMETLFSSSQGMRNEIRFSQLSPSVESDLTDRVLRFRVGKALWER